MQLRKDKWSYDHEKDSPRAMESIPYSLYYGTFVDTPELGEIRIRTKCLIGVNQQGVIDFIHPDVEQPSVLEVFKHNYVHFDSVQSYFNQFFFPGFIDTHIHASQYPNVGIGLNIPLLDWLKIYTFSLENSFNKENFKVAKDIYTKVIKKTLTNGTTCASYFTTIDTDTSKLFGDLLLEFGQRGFVGKVCMNHNTDYPEYQETEAESLNSIKHLIEYFDGKNPEPETLVKPIITPRFAPVCTRSLLKKLGQVSTENNLPIQTHISENKGEIQLVKKLFPECQNYASVYDDHNLLSSSTILAHAIHLSDSECKLIKKKSCSISHCPTSNTFIASGEAPVKQYLYKHKINVSLGTDISGGFDPSILGIVRQSILVSHHLSMKTNNNSDKLSLNDALYMSTQAGAIAVGMESEIGTFDIGKKFDSQLIDLGGMSSSIDLFDWQLPNKSDDQDELQSKILNLLNKWVFSGDDRNCLKVYVNGRLVLDKSNQWVLVN
ncbi:Metallo-dependent hydrolase [Yamadazyma tenuis ATCC 10573]|uniref:Probable guanine deaminase n=1 Tax=Candida tenuis (strain ATCC 10573 / BCRC 21748 / CBS 615 / JCM 9827 / NBRC 10315 / NRRL Y-1498 / VKM Y-70) TaxID=590646 RepID=G3BAH5_CANTC|nr:Metallo-dependent hydrolase [Yamadazyma tenuis ATCC 10573]EGV62063.1 Metallo-dependent hydrolase [Yamadazyma tenuis ATCC 10573]